MLLTLVFGASVHTGDGHHGTLKRVIVNNGIANQFTVNPSGLFSGPERVVPISDVAEASADGIKLTTTEVEWKAYNAFNMDQILVADSAAAPQLLTTSPQNFINDEALAKPTAEAPSEERALDASSVVLTSDTLVGDHGTLTGLVVDTGRPTQLLVGDRPIPFAHVGVLDEKHIRLGDALPRMDNVTPPSSVGQGPDAEQPHR